MRSQISPSGRCRTAFELLAALIALLGYLPAARAAAEIPGDSMFSFSAFGTFGLVHSSETQADFTSSRFKPNGAGYTHPWSSDVDSRIGAQVTANLTSQLSAVLQVISEQNYDNTYRPHVEWANLKYEVTPDLSVRAGRTVLSSFLFSDSLKVGYAIPWVRPPIDLYSLVPIASSDGVDGTYRFHVADATNTTVATYGKTHSEMPDGGHAEARRQWAITDTLEFGPATLYVTYHEAHLTITSLNAFIDVFRNFGSQGIALAEKYGTNDKPLTFFGLGGNYDPGKWFVMGEWGTTNLNSVLGESTAWYVSGGYRLAKFTPFLTYGLVKADSNTSDPGLNVSALPPYLAGPAIGLNAGLNAILGSIPVQKTISVGTRWDLVKNVDLKLQYDHTDLGAGSTGTLVNVQPGFRPGGTVNLASIAVDFLW
jgi:hypothetical protein